MDEKLQRLRQIISGAMKEQTSNQDASMVNSSPSMFALHEIPAVFGIDELVVVDVVGLARRDNLRDLSEPVTVFGRDRRAQGKDLSFMAQVRNTI